jgi:N-succinyldiaminopimelate aminotransferase
MMNPDLNRLQPYPFEQLNQLKGGITPVSKPHIALSIGEPKHQPPGFVVEELITHLHGLASYPLTKGRPELRQVIAHWLTRRFALPQGSIDAERHVLPVAGTREALFAFAQAVVDRSKDALVLSPNPFYQIYEGAALLAGAEPYFLNTSAENDFLPDLDAVPAEVWQRCQLIYLCTPGNPTGAVAGINTLQKLIRLADEHDFIIASDECYSELYFDTPPPGLLQAAAAMGRDDYKRCVVFHSLSKRSNLPGLRSGFVAGDAEVLAGFLKYRTYHGCALPAHTQAASIAAWNDEAHVITNRALYRQKFDAVLAILQPIMKVARPDAGFYLWAECAPLSDTEFAQKLFAQQNVTVLPGSYLSRHAHGVNPGAGRIRMALVAELDECIEAAERIRQFFEQV